ncbi:sigma-54 interaction domain-containing protein [Papillibacter cinnamivorans]|uniref:PAS domain S-box-containing protein n=1 Tax=Papillibacter cinnamivorans DSM 12816 TaxID=1122930 RepID=A0A1W2BVK6_9FIRM|nr:sigma 54-interacting transcriptional regulator [Papillibacter cinnamivorans]SMC77035.1 PAS domain S-box-containing protein [Papillibacter cinnamivorans DSM 12816]
MYGEEVWLKIQELKRLTEELEGKPLISGEDKTELKRCAGELLREYNAYKAENINFKAVVDNLVEGVYVTDRRDVTQYVNPAYLKHTGTQREKVLGRTVQEIVDEGILYREPQNGEQRKSTPDVLKSRDGHVIRGYVTSIPAFDEGGDLRRVIVSVFDTQKLKIREDTSLHRHGGEEPIEIWEDFGKEGDNPMIGSDPSMRKIKRTILRAAPTDVTILITGESGVGKEAVADKIYQFSKRGDGPYVKVNCAAIPTNLLESELFGYEKGAFTGANPAGKAGLFELADHGTILLDEIGDLSPELQIKLLRVLQQKELMRIGATRPTRLDVRIIAATNADLKKKILEGKFREDLYYRLSVVLVDVPPLRERKQDIGRLTGYYFEKYCLKHGRKLRLTDEARMLFQSYEWPGNVRELQNVIENAVICSEGEQVEAAGFSERLGFETPPTAGEPFSLQSALDSYEKGLIEAALAETGGVRRAAAFLNVDPSTISRKARKFCIRIEHKDK